MNLKLWIYLFTAVGFILASFQSSANERLGLYACDTCDFNRMRVIAQNKAPLLHCEGGINPETGVADPAYWGDNAYCTAPEKTLIVANPLSREAYKFHVRRDNSPFNQPGFVSTLTLSSDEIEITETYYDIYYNLREAVDAINLPAESGMGSLSSSAPCTQTLAASGSSGGSDSCQNSAAAHLISSPENKARLLNDMRSAIKDVVGRNSWRDFSSSFSTSGQVTSGGLSITAGVTPGVTGSTSVAVHQEYLQNDLVVTPVGARSCGFWGLFCKEADRDNQIHYRVNYHGDASTRGINELQVSFTLLTAISHIEGWSASDQLGLGSRNLTGNPDSCLSQLINSMRPGDGGFVSEGTQSPVDSGGGNFEYCEQSKTVRACTNTGDGTTSVCHDMTFVTLTMCN